MRAKCSNKAADRPRSVIKELQTLHERRRAVDRLIRSIKRYAACVAKSRDGAR